MINWHVINTALVRNHQHHLQMHHKVYHGMDSTLAFKHVALLISCYAPHSSSTSLPVSRTIVLPITCMHSPIPMGWTPGHLSSTISRFAINVLIYLRLNIIFQKLAMVTGKRKLAQIDISWPSNTPFIVILFRSGISEVVSSTLT